MHLVRLIFALLLPTRLKTVLTVEGEHDLIVERCEHALRTMGQRLANPDGIVSDYEMMIARIDGGWPLVRDTVTVQIERQKERYYLIHIMSETTLFGVMRDWKRNARNIDRFIAQIDLR